jgi:fumarylacetoacetate (FAA) hydrolase
VSNRDADGGPGRPIAEGGLGYSCIAEVRMVEKILTGEMKMPFLNDGDIVRIDVRDDAGHSIFGAIEQTVRKV